MSVGDIVHVALEKQEFLQGLTADYARLHEDPERWGQHLAERQEWDSLT